MSATICPATSDGAHRGIGGFGYCTECSYRPTLTATSDRLRRRVAIADAIPGQVIRHGHVWRTVADVRSRAGFSGVLAWRVTFTDGETVAYAPHARVWASA